MSARKHAKDYLLEEISAMRWLKEQGLSAKQIQSMRWGMVDESERLIHYPASVTSYWYNKETGEIQGTTEEKMIEISTRGSGHEWFFLKSKYMCPWMFTKEITKSWRKEKSREACYSVKYVENLTRDVPSPVVPQLLKEIEVLTKTLVSDKMKVSIKNITKTETKEPTRVTATKV